MKRIMMIAPHYEEYAFLLSCALGDHAEVLLVLRQDLLDRDFAGRPRPAAPNVMIRHNSFRTVAEFGRLLADLRRFRPDVLHWQEPSGFIKAVMAAAMVAWAGRFTRTALTIHDVVPHSGDDARVAARFARIRRHVRARVHRVFVHGPTSREQYLCDYLPMPHTDERVRLTDHGVILAGDTPCEPGDGFRALMFGRMEAYKGLDVLLPAITDMANRGCAVDLELAGSGPEIDRLENDFRAVPHVRVDNRFVSSALLIEKIRAADCVLLPYLDATQSGVLAAAFANGRFVIASRVGGLSDLVEHGVNGLLVPPGDAPALVDALDMVAGDAGLRQRLRAGARRTAEDRLDWGPIAARMIGDY
ncbi:glycosyltransferase family 4 protein [Sphingomonas sp. R86520]|uniref:glycosyltransferase family 4 protein n=1 Tax=Sphingomonas sp. R86520 TaxID=3093859 RepID=UPI0036D2B656